MGCEVENPNKGRLRNLEEAEHFLSGGTEVGLIEMRIEFLMERLAAKDEELFARQYEEFLIRRAEETKKDLEGLTHK